MATFLKWLKLVWLWMLEPPWHHLDQGDLINVWLIWYRSVGATTMYQVSRWAGWAVWLVGWAWSLAGLLLGAFLAPSLLQLAGFWGTRYQDILVVGVAALTAFFVQLLGWGLLALVFVLNRANWEPTRVLWLQMLGGSILPLAGVGYGIYRYVTWVGSGRREVTIAFVGGLLIKTFLIPFIKSLVTGALFRWFIRWLRGDKAKAKGA